MQLREYLRNRKVTQMRKRISSVLLIIGICLSATACSSIRLFSNIMDYITDNDNPLSGKNTDERIIILNYSWNNIWTDNCTMKLKIAPCSHNTAQFLRQKGVKSLSQSSEQLLSCQGSLIVAIPVVHLAYRY